MPPGREADAGRTLRTGAVLAGGRSCRMGRPKHALRLGDGRSFLEAAIAALDAVCPRVVVVTADEADGGPVAIPPGVARITDLRRGTGPLGALEALLAGGGAADYLVCPCDLPLISPLLLARLAAGAGAPAAVFRVAGEPRPRPLPARISAEALPVVTSLLDGGRRAVGELMAELHADVVPLCRREAAGLLNVNTPGDYRSVCGSVSGAGRRLSAPPSRTPTNPTTG